MNMIEKTADFYKILFQTADSKSQQFSSYSDVRNYYSGLYKNDPKIEKEIFLEINGKAISETISDKNINTISVLSPYGQLITSNGQIKKEAYEKYISTEDGSLVSGMKGNAIWRGDNYLLDEELNIPKTIWYYN